MSPIPFNQHRFYLDVPLLVLIFLLMAVSLVILYSTGGANIMVSQSLRFGLGLVGMLLVLLVPKNLIRFFAPTFYVVTLLMLIAVYFFGVSINNSQRWLNIGIAQIQPSEIAKLAIPLMLAYYFYAKSLPPTLKDIAIALVITLLPALLVLQQPDLGTAILVATSGFILLFLAGISWRIMITAIVALSIAAPIYWFQGMETYQKKRVLTVFNPEADPTGDGYNIIQSKIAIGSGGMNGRGFMQGVQSKEFLPENTTDFIFAAFSEEFGFIGVALLFSLYFLILIRSFWLSLKMTDNFSRLLSGALIFIFFIYFFINVGMVSGVLPVVGLPLPLISFGGTSIMTLMVGFGLIMNLYAARSREKKPETW